MKRCSQRICHWVIRVAVLSLLGLSPVDAEEQTLARLSFWVPPERMEEFETVYEKQVIPILKKHDIVESSKHGRSTVDSVFSRLYTFAELDTFFAHRYSLWNDSTWQTLRKHLGENFRSADPDNFIRSQFVPYQCPVVAERSILAGSGTRRKEWRTLGVQDGLPSPDVSFLLTDQEGHLWFTGRGRLTRYDGGTFVTFVTADSLVAGHSEPMLLDRDGNLWFTGLGGVTRYDGETFTTFTSADGLAGDLARCLLQDRRGNLWFGFDTGVTRYDGMDFQTFASRDGLVSVDVFSILEDRDGILWFGGGLERHSTGWRSKETGGVTQYDGTAFTTLTGKDSPVDHVVLSMLQDRHSHLWFGGENQITRYDGKNSKTFTTRDGLVEGLILTMLEDRDGHLWFGSHTHGINRFDGKVFTTFTTESGLPDNQVRSMIEDEEGYLWVGTHAGLSRYEGSHWTTFTPRDGLPSSYVFSVLQDRAGIMWFGTHGGLVRYDGEELVTFTTEDGLAEDRADYLTEDLDGNLWIKGCGGPKVTCYDGKAFSAFTFGDSLDIGFVDNQVMDRNGHLWFPAAPFGVVRYDGQSFSTFTKDDGLISDMVVSVEADGSGNVWFGIYGGGVSRYDGETFTSFTNADGLGFKPIAISAGHKGDLWFGSNRGVIGRYDGNAFTRFAVGDGLKAGIVRAILTDRRGHLWFGIHGAGIVRYDGLVFQDLHHRDGLVADSVQDIFQDRDGDFWIASDSGITRYRPSTVPPSIHLIEVVADSSYGAAAELALPSSQSLIQFTFQGRSFSTPPNRMVYVYRLQGYDDKWQPTRETQVRYKDLSVGDYIFQVKAVDRDLNYSKPATVKIRVHLPYERLGLWSILGLATLALLWQAGRIVQRDRRLQEANQKLQEANQQIQEDTRRKSDFLARMSHDLRTPMNAIIGYTRILLRRLSDTIEPRQLHNLENIDTSAHNLLNLINEILDLSRVEAGRIDIHPQPVDLQQLTFDCVTAIEPLIQAEVQLIQDIEAVPSLRTDGEILRKVLMNLLGNAVKFTDAGNITISVKSIEDQVEISVADTGMGIPSEDLPYIFEEFRQVERQGSTEKEGTGLGLAIARKSVELLGGTISAESEVGTGTTFTLRVKDYPSE